MYVIHYLKRITESFLSKEATIVQIEFYYNMLALIDGDIDKDKVSEILCVYEESGEYFFDYS